MKQEKTGVAGRSAARIARNIPWKGFLLGLKCPKPGKILEKKFAISYFRQDPSPTSCSGNWNILPIERLASDVFPTFHANTPDGKQFFQASKRQVPSFSVNSHPSVQNRSTLQLIYQLLWIA